MSMDDLIRLKPKYPNQELNVVIPLRLYAKSDDDCR